MTLTHMLSRLWSQPIHNIPLEDRPEISTWTRPTLGRLIYDDSKRERRRFTMGKPDGTSKNPLDEWINTRMKLLAYPISNYVIAGLEEKMTTQHDCAIELPLHRRDLRHCQFPKYHPTKRDTLRYVRDGKHASCITIVMMTVHHYRLVESSGARAAC